MGSRTVIVNTLYSTTLRLTEASVLFFSFPYLLHHFGGDHLGIYLLVNSIVFLLMFLSIGINLSLMKFIPEYLETRDRDGLNAVYTLSFGIAALSALLISAAMVLLAWRGLGLLEIDEPLRDEARRIFLVIAVGVLFQVILSVYEGVLYGAQAFSRVCGAGIVQEALRVGLIWMTLHFGLGLVTYVAWTALLRAGHGLVLLTFARRAVPFLRLELSSFRLGSMKRHLGLNLYQVVNQVADTLMVQTDKIVMEIFHGPVGVTSYHIASSPDRQMQSFISLPLGALVPSCASAWARGDLPFIRRVLTLGNTIYLALTIPAAALLFANLEDFFTQWLGAHPGGDVVLGGRLFLVAIAVACPFKVATHVMFSKGRVFLFGATKIVCAVLNLAASILLCRRYGLIGVVIPTVAFWALAVPAVNLYYLRTEQILGTLRYLRPTLPVGLCAAGAWIVSRRCIGLVPEGILPLLAYLAALALLFTLLAGFLSLSMGELRELASKAKGLFPRSTPGPGPDREGGR